MSEPKSTTSVIIANVEIYQDAHERYNLNTLHKASGAGQDKLPSQWLRRQSTRELIDMLKSATGKIHSDVVVSVNGGRYAGVYAHELLAVSFAGWLSPKFQLLVNQTFADVQRRHHLDREPTGITHQLDDIWQALQGDGGLLKRLETLEQHFGSLATPVAETHAEETRQRKRVRPSPHLPNLTPPTQPIEKAHVTECQLRVWRVFRTSTDALSCQDIAAVAHVDVSTAHRHARYFLHLGLLDLYEMFPRHLYRLSPQADKRHAAYYQRLELLADIAEKRQHRLTDDDLRLFRGE
jgi:hypothetical protein